MILAILLRTGKKNAAVVPAEWVSRQYIFEQLSPFYVPSRTRKAKPEDPPVKPVNPKRGRAIVAKLTHATFSGFLSSLLDAGLIDEETGTANKKEKIYRINDRGEIAFRFFSDPGTNSLIRTLLEKV
jgi:hypothetical protein